jgi:hypothetical protein
VATAENRTSGAWVIGAQGDAGGRRRRGARRPGGARRWRRCRSGRRWGEEQNQGVRLGEARASVVSSRDAMQRLQGRKGEGHV